MHKLSERHAITKVWLADDGWLYKSQPKHLAQNEWYFLNYLRHTGFVPQAQLLEEELIRMEYIPSESLTDEFKFREGCGYFLRTINGWARHGDLTAYAVIIRDSWPVIIDWAESRLWADPRPDKRPGGDSLWLNSTAEELIAHGGNWVHERP